MGIYLEDVHLFPRHFDKYYKVKAPQNIFW